MTAALEPFVEQLRDAADNRQRAQLLLSCPDATLLRCQEAAARICTRTDFEAGCQLVALRIAALLAVRDAAGCLPMAIARPLENWRAALARYAAGLPPA